MTKIKRFARCPGCDELITVTIDDKIKPDRWPLKLEGEHNDHGYIVLFDSHYGITDIKKKPSKVVKKQTRTDGNCEEFTQ